MSFRFWFLQYFLQNGLPACTNKRPLRHPGRFCEESNQQTCTFTGCEQFQHESPQEDPSTGDQLPRFCITAASGNKIPPKDSHSRGSRRVLYGHSALSAIAPSISARVRRNPERKPQKKRAEHLKCNPSFMIVEISSNNSTETLH